eukprot:jgi/Psemu1/62411/gm1.62411_g
MPTPFDWTPIFGIAFRFTSASNPTAAASLNKAYSEIIDKDELSEFFVTLKEEGPLEIAPDPQLHILNCIAKAIAINLIDPDAVTQGHIVNLLSKCVIKHVRNNGFQNKWRPDLFMQAYTGDPPSATASRAQFANLVQRKYTTSKAAPPAAPILAPATPPTSDGRLTFRVKL